MKMEPFIITLTGASASGKSFVIDKFIEVAEEIQSNNTSFVPVPFKKYSTREYRANEIAKRQQNEFVDVDSVDVLPTDCDLIYRTYGKEYGLRTKDLKERLDQGESPLVVINDVRAVEELKNVFEGRVLSLFLFRHVPNFDEIKNESVKRGNVSEKELMDRYIKATSLYRIYIENITIFDRVVLNVKDENEDEHKCTRLQIFNILQGIFDKKIPLNKNYSNGAKLFIISGNNASGKDDVNRAVQKMGKLQAKVIPKYTSRRQEDDDENEMICRLIPRSDLINKYEAQYTDERDLITAQYDQEMPQSFKMDCRSKFEMNSNETLEDYCNVQWDISRLKDLRNILKPYERFWSDQKDNEDFFQKNIDYINLEELKKKSNSFNPKENDELCYLSIHEDSEYLIYENHGKQVKYAFNIEGLPQEMISDKKHRVLVASLVNVFEYCKEKIGSDEVIPIFSYSQISKEDYDRQVETEIEKLKSQSYDDLIRYSKFIVDFKHVIIYAETEMQKQSDSANGSGGQKEELIDQMFRLFRAYK